ncbi:MAG: ATP-grasp domain-containing protein, partial [Nitrospinota bacterium]|nr:ATP-grasp domain-containing protein [Nitrospinota bacterium]
DRESFKLIMDKLGLRQPHSGTATGEKEALRIAEQIGYPVMVRPSYVLGGRAMETVYDAPSLSYYMKNAVEASPDHPVLIDDYLESAIEFDVDAICDGEMVVVAGVMEHIEKAGVHSGDSACSLPPHTVGQEVVDEIKRQARVLAMGLGTVGLINIQFAVQDGDIYILEANPRASRTIPFVSKAVGAPMAQLAARVMAGKKLKELGFTADPVIKHVAVKESVFPFNKFPGVDTILGPEMKSTGEVMGLDCAFGHSFGKASLAAGTAIPRSGAALISVADSDKPAAVAVAGRLIAMGFTVISTPGTHAAMLAAGLAAQRTDKVGEGKPDCAALVNGGSVHMVINTTHGKKSIKDSFAIRRAALVKNIPYFTTMRAAESAADAVEAARDGVFSVAPLQEYFPKSAY